MSVPIAYVTIIVIWTTTPLGIQWSSHDIGYELGVAARMLIGLILVLTAIGLHRTPFPWDARSRRVYWVGGLSLFLAMTCIYWAAQHIPSGWIAVIFGLSPILTGVFATLLLGHRAFSEGRLYGMLLGLLGLGVIFIEGATMSTAVWLGIFAVITGAMAQSSGAVILKKLGSDIPAISITAGSLIVAVPLFTLNALLFSPGLPLQVSGRTVAAILYLAIFGTGLGFPLYYYILRHLSPNQVALITLITPVSALLLGAALNDEIITARVWLGTGLILIGLFVHEFSKTLRLDRGRA